MNNNRIGRGFLAGCLGAVVLVVVMYILKAAGVAGDPGFVTMYNKTFLASPKPPGDAVIAAVLFILSGGVWGVIYALLIKQPTVLNGFLFGLLPTLWLWIVVNAFLHQPLFNGFTVKGLVMPLIFNMVIWGCFVGWFLSRRQTDVKRV